MQLDFSSDAIAEIARIAMQVNEQTENIGARRLHTVLEKLLEDIAFDAPETTGAVRSTPPTYAANSRRSPGTPICRISFYKRFVTRSAEWSPSADKDAWGPSGRGSFAGNV